MDRISISIKDIEGNILGENGEDSIAISVRAAVRNIDSALLTLDLQEKGVEIAKLGQESIEARKDSATVLEQLESINNLLSAENDVSDAKRKSFLADVANSVNWI